MKINILESEWTIEYCNTDADPQLEGGRSRKENEQIREKMKNVPTDESMVLVAIGQYIGEGVNYPRFDTMMLVPPPIPIAWQGNVEQYSGRLHRDFAVIDKKIVWYGSVNLLSNAKEEDNLMRVKSKEIAQELLEIVVPQIK